jgi:hypothetical protein
MPGQFCWIIVPHLDPIPRILDVERESPEEHERVRFLLRNANKTDDFTKRDRVLPLQYLKLRSNEELLVQCAKKRPAIILSANTDVFPDIEKILRQRGKKHYQQNCLILAPCYHFETEFDPTGFPVEMKARIRCMVYRQFFYIPESPKVQEGVARFDRIQVIVDRSQVSSIDPCDFRLSDEVIGTFLGLFEYCITGVEDNNLKAIRDLARECLSSIKS